MAIAPNPNILDDRYDRNAPLDLGYFENNFRRIVCCIPFAGDVLGVSIQAKLARQETASQNFYHKSKILEESLIYDAADLFRSYFFFLSTPWLLSLAPPSPLIMISLIGFSILTKNILIFGDLERRFGKYSAIPKIALLALNYAFFTPQLRMFFLTKNIGYLGGAILVGQLPLIIMKTALFRLKEFEYDRVKSAINSYEMDIRFQTAQQRRIDHAAESSLQNALSYWRELLPQGQERLPRAEALKFDDNTRARDQCLFRDFLNRLQDTADFRQASPENRQNFALRVATIVRDMASSKEFCEKAIWELDIENDACGDRVATGIESLEILSLIHGQNKPQTEVDAACLAIRLDRLDRVRKKAIALNPGPEGLETVLFLQLELKDLLKLPLQTGGMLYPAVGQVSDEAVRSTAQEILALTSTDAQVVAILTDSCVWTDRLKHHFADFYEDVMRGFEISAGGGGLDYAKNLANFSENPTGEWTEFLGQISPDHIQEVMQTLQEICPSLLGKDYISALTGPNGLIQRINRKKTIEWLRANSGALRAKLN